MPPKPKRTKAQVIEAGVTITKEKGIDAVNAREIAKELDCSTGPIFTYFDTMDQLKDEVYQHILLDCTDYLKESFDYWPTFKEFGMRWIRYAAEYPNFYKLIFVEGRPVGKKFLWTSDLWGVIVPILKNVMETFELTEEEARDLMKKMTTHAQGVAAMLINDIVVFDEKTICKEIGELCISQVAGYKIMNGTLNTEMISMMLARAGELPVKREN